MKGISDPRKHVASLRFARILFDPGIEPEKLNASKQKEVIGGISSLPSSNSNRVGEEMKDQSREEKSAMPALARPARKRTWNAKWNPSEHSSLITSACRILDQASISRGRNFCPFWTKSSGEISRKLCLPTGTGCADSGLNLSNELFKPKKGESWFCMTREELPSRNSSGIFSQLLQSSAAGSTVYEVTHSKEKLGKREKFQVESKSGKAYKTLKIRLFPSKNKQHDVRLLADCARQKWYYNACIDIFDWVKLKAQLEEAKSKDLPCPSFSANEIRNRVAWHEFQEKEEMWGDKKVIVQSFVFQDECKEEQIMKEKIKVEKEIEKARKKEENKKKRLEEKETMKNMSKKEKKEYCLQLKTEKKRLKEEGKEKLKQSKKINGNIKKTKRDYPQAEWIETCYGQKIEGKTLERIIRGACANFTSNLNSAIKNYCNGHISKFNMNFRTSKSVNEFLSFDDGNFPTYIKNLRGYYGYRLARDPQLSCKKRRVHMTLEEIISQRPNTPISITHDKQTKEWTLHFPVERDWFPSDDRRGENQALKTVNGEAIGLDPGMRKFLTGYSTTGEILTVGNRAFKKLTPLLFRIDTLAYELSQLRKERPNISDQHLMENMILAEEKWREKFELWKYVKNMIADLHWKVATYLCRNYQYIFLENLSSKSCVQGKIAPFVKRILLQYSFYKFKQRLTYMCEKYGCKLILVAPALTTKTCSNCGSIYEVARSETYNCPNCSFSCDRDINSAKNILIKGMTIMFGKLNSTLFK